MKQVIIETNQLSKSYVVGKSGNNVLKNIDLTLYEGDFTVIMGSSGSGKSTLLYTLSSMAEPTSGIIKLLGHDMATIKDKDVSFLRKQEISFIFQSIHLLPDLTAFENIAYTGYGNRPKAEVNQQAQSLLETFDLATEGFKYPSELSGGQQQRVAIARALINQAKIIFADEPTGALNSQAGENVLDILSNLNQSGQSIVMVTHDLKASIRANRLIYLKDGRISGDLALGPYSDSQKKQREDVVFDFLKHYQW